LGNGKNRRDRIDGKNEVGEFDANQHRKHRRGSPLHSLPNKEFITLKLLGERMFGE